MTFKKLAVISLTLAVFTANARCQSTTTESSSATESPVSLAVVAYLNSRINQLLTENPEKNLTDLQLVNVFNEERRKLTNSLIPLQASESDDVKAEQAIENFEKFLQSYNVIEKMLRSALDDINVYEDNENFTARTRYTALLLMDQLQNSTTLEDAGKALMVFDGFKRGLECAPVLNDEYREYFEEILRTLQTHVRDDTLEVKNLLKQILVNTEELLLSAAYIMSRN